MGKGDVSEKCWTLHRTAGYPCGDVPLRGGNMGLEMRAWPLSLTADMQYPPTLPHVHGGSTTCKKIGF